MFAFFKEKNNPLHLAVIEGESEKAIRLSENKELLLERNGLGFTPLELAHYLQRIEIVAALDPPHSSTVELLLPGSSDLERIEREKLFASFKFHYADSLHFSNYADFTYAAKKGKGLLTSLFTGEEAFHLGKQYRHHFTKGTTEGFSIRWIDNTLGYGLFAEREFGENSFIGEYTGLFRRVSRCNPSTNAYCFHYPLALFTAKVCLIDALNVGNIFRFVNHCDIPNLKQQQMIDRGILHIGLFSVRKIDKGEQLTIDYGKDYWQRRRKKEL